MSAPSGRRDMRKWSRKPVEIPVTVRSAGRSAEGSIVLDAADVSEGGAFLKSSVLLEVGDIVHLEVRLPGGAPIKMDGKIARVSKPRGKELVPGMGIEFIRISADGKRALAAATAQPLTTKA